VALRKQETELREKLLPLQDEYSNRFKQLLVVRREILLEDLSKEDSAEKRGAARELMSIIKQLTPRSSPEE
jgi:hypothetical protein